MRSWCALSVRMVRTYTASSGEAVLGWWDGDGARLRGRCGSFLGGVALLDCCEGCCEGCIWGLAVFDVLRDAMLAQDEPPEVDIANRDGLMMVYVRKRESIPRGL